MAVVCLLAAANIPAAAKTCTCDTLPVVHIPGIGSPLYMNGTGQGITLGTAGGGMNAALGGLWDLLWAPNTEEALTKLKKLVKDLVGKLQADTAGNTVEPLTPAKNWADPAQDHTKNRNYYFHYDWRLDPMQAARSLNTFIKQVQEVTGHKKIILAAHSEGGIVGNAYLALYGHGSLDHYIADVSAAGGVTLIEELFTGNLMINRTSFKALLQRMLGWLVGGSLSLTADVGFYDGLIKDAKELLAEGGERLTAEVFTPYFAQWPALWAFITNDSKYTAAKKYMLDSKKHAALIEKIDAYHNQAGRKAAALLKAAKADGVKVSIIAKYGWPAYPFFPGWEVSTDTIIDTARESFGARVAKNNQNLGKDYKQTNSDGHNHISPNKQIDASTCAFPESTWFFKSLAHGNQPSGEFLAFLYNSKEQPTVHSDKRFPQFMKWDGFFRVITADS
jgi:pimeloyl-ACP methyl ester carboxylesterase